MSNETKTERPKVEAGRTYLCSIDTAIPGVSKSGTPRVTFDFVVIAGERKGAHLREDFYLSTKAKWKIQSLLEAIDETSLGEREAVQLMEKFSGKKLMVRTKEEPGRVDEATGTEYPARVRASNFMSAGQAPAKVTNPPTGGEEIPF